MFLRLFKYLLPRARAWSLTAAKPLRKFWEALTILGANFKIFADTIVYDDYFAQKTTVLDEWWAEYGLLPVPSLTEQQQRDRLAAAWAEYGGQSPQYIQDKLQQAGFDVYVHEWWLPGYSILCGEPLAQCGEPLAQCGQFGVDIHFTTPTVKNPLDYLRQTYLAKGGVLIQCGGLLAQCGEPLAQCGQQIEKIEYPLVNKIPQSIINYTILCGEPLAQCGEPLALCGEFDRIINTERDYTIPSDPIFWPYFTYIGGKIFPQDALVPRARKSEFETLCLKVCPAHQWLGMLIKYI